jgi:hypothetical protein
MRVIIGESGNSEDFYKRELDGPSTYQLLRLLGIEPELKYVIDRKHLRAAIQLATSQKTDVFHLSCHGDEEGIELCSEEVISWSQLSTFFQSGPYCPDALVMSACCGASAGIADEFAKRDKRPLIIFGTTQDRTYSQFAVAWSILYRRFNIGGVKRKAAQEALRHIYAVVHSSFRYYGWDTKKDDYETYPEEGTTYAVEEYTTD